MLAASGWPKMPKTPHSSLNLSIRRSFFRNMTQSPPTTSARLPRPICRSSPRPPVAIAEPVSARPTDRRCRERPPPPPRASTRATFSAATDIDDPRRRFAEQSGAIVDAPVDGQLARLDRDLRSDPRRRRSSIRQASRAIPPSEQSSAERISRSAASATRSACSARSRSRSSTGGSTAYLIVHELEIFAAA